jgi:hypothetical protein
VSQPSSVSPVGAEIPAQKQRADVYTVMLIISFICIVTATVLLYAELERWGSYPWWKTSDATASAILPGVQPDYQFVSNTFIA